MNVSNNKTPFPDKENLFSTNRRNLAHVFTCYISNCKRDCYVHLQVYKIVYYMAVVFRLTKRSREDFSGKQYLYIIIRAFKGI